MLELTTTAAREGRLVADALADADAAEAFWGSLPRRDPIEMQRRLCEVLAKGAWWEKPEVERFRALRVLDRRAGRLLEGIVAQYAVLEGESPVLERPLWHAALELSRSFAHDFDRFLHAVRAEDSSGSWLERTPEILVRLFQHREIELLLALFRYLKWPRGRWTSLHELFRFATASGFAAQAVPMGKRADGSIITVTPEQVYVRILLLQLLDGGQFRPEEIAWARRAIVDWSENLELRKLRALPQENECQDGFVVDLAGTKGLTRIDAATAGDLLWLDTTPIRESISAAMAERAEVPIAGTSMTLRSSQPRLLGKLQLLYAPQPTRIKRRGERAPVGLTPVEAKLGGLQTLFRAVREETQREAVPATMWQVKDRSDSGSRLRGHVPDARRLLPGLLFAFREDHGRPWTVAVLRRLNRLTGNHVEIGVEHIGRDPQPVILLSRPDGQPIGAAPEAESERFIALYLPESDAYPKTPVETLLIPGREFALGRVLTLRSTTREVAIRLKRALEHQAEFVWAVFEPLDAAA
ncbi:MAG TPA: hypothetical protein VF814_10335 [Casimicrobiaceae bacterium]